MLYGGRLSITLAVLVSMVAVACGLLIGLVAGYFRRLDPIVMRIMDGIMAIPGLLLAVTLVALAGANIASMVVAISFRRFRGRAPGAERRPLACARTPYRRGLGRHGHAAPGW